jgi:L-threonylcarbamoyladenylate synthase
MLERHYSPRTPVDLSGKIDRTRLKEIPADEAVLLLVKPAYQTRNNVFWLTEKGELPLAAHLLFAMLRQLDNGRWRKINAETAPGRSALAMAINDRLARAAVKK